jgi:hypothetical protein
MGHSLFYCLTRVTFWICYVLLKIARKPPEFSVRGIFVPEIGVVPKVRVELTRVAPLVFETSASTIPPLRHRVIL